MITLKEYLQQNPDIISCKILDISYKNITSLDGIKSNSTYIII